jgi:hypothetical protein
MMVMTLLMTHTTEYCYIVVLLLPVSLDCDFLIAPSVFSDVYLTIFIPCYNLILLWLNIQCSNIQWYASSAMS